MDTRTIAIPGYGSVGFDASLSDDDLADRVSRYKAQKDAEAVTQAETAVPGTSTIPPEGSYTYKDSPVRLHSQKTKGPRYEQRDAPKDVDNLIRVLASGASMGTAEPTAAAIRHFLPESWGGLPFREGIADEDKRTSEARESLGYGAIPIELAGTVAGTLAAPVFAPFRAAPTATKTAKMLGAMKEGAAYGTVGGAAATRSDDPVDYMINSLLTAGGGAGLAGLTGGISMLASNLLSRFRNPAKPPTPTHQTYVNTLDAEGVPMSSGIRTGNPKLMTREDVTAKLPSGNAPEGMPDEALVAATQAALRRAGVHAPSGSDVRATDDVLKKAFGDIGQRIENVQGRYTIDVNNNPNWLNRLANVDTMLPSLMGDAQHIKPFIDRMLSKTQWTPEEAKLLRTQLSEAYRGMTGPNVNKTTRNTLMELRNTLDDALEQTILAAGNPAEVAALRQARQQYANINNITDAIAGSGKSGEYGVFTPTALKTAMDKAMGRKEVAKGKGDLTDLASAIRALLPAVSDSGTTTRASSSWLNPYKIAEGQFGNATVTSPAAQARHLRTRSEAEHNLVTRPYGASAAGALTGTYGSDVVDLVHPPERKARGGYLRSVR